MSKERIYLFDTTLRDGSQTQGVDFSLQDKIKISKALAMLGLDYIEAGWPGANPLDTSFFNGQPDVKDSTFVAFGMTKKSGRSALRPLFLVIPKATKVESLTSGWPLKKLVSNGLAPGHPASI